MTANTDLSRFELILELTPECNYKCPFCYCLWHEFPELAENCLTFEQWKKIIEDAVKKGCRKFLFTGGEVLLYPDLKALIEYARTFPDVELELFTNASQMTEEYLQYLKQQRVRLAVSLPGLRTYGKMTGTKRKFDRTVDFIAWCREIDYPCTVSITVPSVNLFEVKDIVCAAAFAGAGIIQLSVFMLSGRGKKNPHLQVSPQQWLALKDEIKALFCAVPIGFCDEFECRCRTEKNFSCPAAGSSFGAISPGGVYRKCLHFYSAEL